MNVFEFFGALFSYLFTLLKIIPLMLLFAPGFMIPLVIAICIVVHIYRKDKKNGVDGYFGNTWGGY